MRNLDNFRQAMESPKIWNSMGDFYPKNMFLQLKHYISRVYLTLLLSTYVKIHQIPYMFFETIKHFSWHNSPIFILSQAVHLLDKNSLSKSKFLDFPLVLLKFTKLLMSFLKQKVSFSSKFRLSWEITLLYFFSWIFICSWQKIEKFFQTCYC